MKKGSFFIRLYIHIFIFLLAAIIGLVLLHSWLEKYTEHGIEVKVPSLAGLYVQEAEPLLRSLGLKLEIIDSTFSKKYPLKSIVEQQPSPNSNVKHGRTIYVLVNAQQRPKVTLPNLQNLSYRQAVSAIQTLNLEVEAVRYQPSTYRNLIMGVMLNGQPLSEGDQIEEDSRLTLIVGKGSDNRLIPMPNLKGRTLQEVKTILIQHFLSLDSCHYDPPADNTSLPKYIVYQQVPIAGQPIVEGASVKISLTNDTVKISSETPSETANKEDTDENELFF